MAKDDAANFQRALRDWGIEAERDVKDVFAIAITEVRRSVVEGSELTGAPGQPVDIGTLKGSWTNTTPAPLVWELTSGLVYARSIEDGVSYAHGGVSLTLRSPVGGFHNIALTEAGWDRIVAFAAQRVSGRRS